MISLEKLNILTPLQKLHKNVGDLGKLIVAMKSSPKSNKSPNLVTLRVIGLNIKISWRDPCDAHNWLINWF